jgi:hypothetical protein
MKRLLLPLSLLITTISFAQQNSDYIPPAATSSLNQTYLTDPTDTVNRGVYNYYGNGRSDRMARYRDLINAGIPTVGTIAALEAYNSPYTTVIVTDETRGGMFNYVNTGLTADGGIVLPATGKGSGSWVRQDIDFIYPEWWGSSNTNSRSFIQSALNYGVGKTVNLRNNLYYIDSTLVIKSNTKLLLQTNTTIMLKDSINRNMIMNQNAVAAGSTALLDSNIIVSGGTWNGNGFKQNLWSSTTGSIIISGISFFNVKNIRVNDLTVRDSRSFAIHIGSYKDVWIDKVRLDNSTTVMGRNLDGVHLNGPGENAFLTGLVVNGDDDQIAINANDAALAYLVNVAGKYGGDIKNTVVDGVVYNNTYKGIRLLSATNSITGTVINNVTGVTSGNILETGNFGLGPGGTLKDLQVSNVNVKVNQTSNDTRFPFRFDTGDYSNINFNNIIVDGNHYNIPTIWFNHSSTFDAFKINDFTSINPDTTSYAEISVTGVTMKNLEINNYKKSGGKKLSSKLLDLISVTAENVSVKNSLVDTSGYVVKIAGSAIKKLSLADNVNYSSTLGNDITTSTIDSLYISGAYFKDNNNLAFTKDAGSTVNTYVDERLKQSNANSTSVAPVQYKSNGTTYVISKNNTETLQSVTNRGATTTTPITASNYIATTASPAVLTATTATTNAKTIDLSNNGVDFQFGIESSTANNFFPGSNVAYESVLYSTNPISSVIGGTTRFRVTATGIEVNGSGNLSGGWTANVAKMGRWSTDPDYARFGYNVPGGGEATNYGFMQKADGSIYAKGLGNFLSESPVSAPNFISTVATGTAPFTVTSTTPVNNLTSGNSTLWNSQIFLGSALSSGDIMQYDGTKWNNATVSVTAPLQKSGAGAGGTWSITQANTSTNGYLSSTDWNTFNNKANTANTAFTGTTTGSVLSFSGAGFFGVGKIGTWTGVNTYARFGYNSPTGGEVTNYGFLQNDAGEVFLKAATKVLIQSNTEALKFITTGGTASQFTMGNGDLVTEIPSGTTQPIINSNATQTTVSGTSSGSIICSMPFQGSSYKKVLIYLNNLTSTSITYTYPVAFTQVPKMDIYYTGTMSPTSNATQISITGTGAGGWITLEGY